MQELTLQSIAIGGYRLNDLIIYIYSTIGLTRPADDIYYPTNQEDLKITNVWNYQGIS